MGAAEAAVDVDAGAGGGVMAAAPAGEGAVVAAGWTAAVLLTEPTFLLTHQTRMC